MSSNLDSKIEIAGDHNPVGMIVGRFMLPDLSEHACQVTDLSTQGATFITANVPLPGLAIVAYLENFGRIEAVTGAAKPGGFEIAFTLKGPRLERLQQRIEWLKQKGNGGTAEDRRHARYEPTERTSHITLPDGRVYSCEVLDISVSGAGIKTEVVPSVGTFLMLGKMRGRVVRYLEQGVAIEFVKQIDSTQFSPDKLPLSP